MRNEGCQVLIPIHRRFFLVLLNLGRPTFFDSVLPGLPLSTVIPPTVLGLGPFQVERVPAWLIPCLRVNQHTGHVLGIDGKHEATMGARL